jgi:hypothetical protein
MVELLATTASRRDGPEATGSCRRKNDELEVGFRQRGRNLDSVASADAAG